MFVDVVYACSVVNNHYVVPFNMYRLIPFCLSIQIRTTFHPYAILLYDPDQRALLLLLGMWVYDLVQCYMNDCVMKAISLFQAYTFPRGISYSYFDVFYSYIPGSWNSINSISGSLRQYTLNNLIFERHYNITIRPKVIYSSCYTNILGPFSPQVNATTMESGKTNECVHSCDDNGDLQALWEKGPLGIISEIAKILIFWGFFSAF